MIIYIVFFRIPCYTYLFYVLAPSKATVKNVLEDL
jgi:hypothetical protein